MAIAGLAQPHPTRTQEPPRPSRRRKWLIAAGWVALAGVMVGIWFAGENWPFRYRRMKPLLQDVFGSQITIAHYHRTYFPHPGFMATGLTIRRKSAPDQPPIGTVQALLVESRWIDVLMLRKRVQRVDMTGVHLVLPAPGSRAAQEDFPQGSTGDFTGPDTPIAVLEAHDSVLDVLRTNGGRFSFPIGYLHIEHMQGGKALTYAVDMENAVPRGRIRASGSFGPLRGQSPGDTLVSGRFTIDQIQLHDVGDISGTMRSSGMFTGKLEEIHATANTQTPDFAVDHGKPTPVAGTIDCTVNGLNGDVVYHSMEARAIATTMEASGSTKGERGKATNLDIAVTRGRAEDLLRPFLHRPVPITGSVALHAHAYLAPANQGSFLERLHVDGAFVVPKERVTDEKTEKSLSAFSERAQGHKTPDPDDKAKAVEIPDAVSSVSGRATISNAVVQTQGLKFTVAGAEAQLDGTFNLRTSEAHLVGKLATKADLSHDTTGFKSFLLKPLAPFFRKKSAGAVIPIAVTGTPGSYKVTEDLTGKK